MQAMCCVRVLPLLAPVVVPVHGIALHAGGTGAAATIADGVAVGEVAADTTYWAGADDSLLIPCCCSVTTIMAGCKYVFQVSQVLELKELRGLKELREFNAQPSPPFH